MTTQALLALELESRKKEIVQNLPAETVEFMLATSKKLEKSGITDHSLKNHSGVIRFAYVNTDYTKRADPADILEKVIQLEK